MHGKENYLYIYMENSNMKLIFHSQVVLFLDMFRIMEKFVIFEIFWINFEIDEKNPFKTRIKFRLFNFIWRKKILYV